MLDRSIEFFTDPNQNLMVISQGKMFPFRDAPLSVLEQLSALLDSLPAANAALDALQIHDPVDRLEKFARCWFGDYDQKADIDALGVVVSEFIECELRGQCQHEGKLCQNVRVADAYLTRQEVIVTQLVCRDLPDKLIADQLGISPNTAKVHIRNILAKIGGHSKAAIAVMGVKKGLI